MYFFSRAVGRVHLIHQIHQHDLVTEQTQLVFRIDQDQAAFGRHFAAPGEQAEADIGAPAGAPEGSTTGPRGVVRTDKREHVSVEHFVPGTH
jgi:hypothetical protein